MASTAASGETLPIGRRVIQQQLEEPHFILGLARHPEETAGDLDPPPVAGERKDRDAEPYSGVHHAAKQFPAPLRVHVGAQPVMDVS
ncbi:hypothetical protein [Streptomyces sviceus]|uniref:hypothetical protein n=1 Tax=Streptomyces sviceus TaxID=285530 RepID=UPI0036C5A978